MKFDSNTTDSQDFEQPAPKTYPARLIGLYDIGQQPNDMGFKNIDGTIKGPSNQVVMTYELVGKDKQSNGENFILSDFVTVSLHVKGTLPKRLQALGAPITKKSDDWFELPKNYNLSILLGEPVMLDVVLKDSGKAKIANVMAPMEGMAIAEPKQPLGFLDLDADDYLDQFAKAPTWIQKKVQKSIGWSEK